MDKVSFGGGCHWCTEAIFQSLIGVEQVDQGWVSSFGENNTFSEGVIVHFNPQQIDLKTLVAIHLYTHSCTSVHTLREKYRSAIYTYSEKQADDVRHFIMLMQSEFDQPIITKVMPFNSFKMNKDVYLDYYYKNPDNPFCQNHITPKLKSLMNKYSKVLNTKKMGAL